MADDQAQSDVGAGNGDAASEAGTKREQSTIGFPYHDLDASTEVAQAVYNRSGLGSCDLDELAAEMGQVISGAFRVKISAAKSFDLIDKDGRSSVKLTELGRRFVTGQDARSARVEAFLRVPLYTAIYDQYKGQKLPPMKALEREMVTLGVSPKVADRARQAFERAARQAGFFDAGDDRLVRPKVDGAAPAQSEAAPSDGPRHERARPVSMSRMELPSGKDHPLIHGLLITLPEPGADWPTEGRDAWLKMAGSIFDMIYKKPGSKAETAADQ
jgi:hypothetical protein